MTAIFVMSVGRSGTSITSRALNLLGADVGPPETLIGPDARRNARGYWEQLPIYDLNERLLAALGASFYQPPAAPPGWALDHTFDELRHEAGELLASLYGDSGTWVVKDARFSVTLPFWRTLVPDPVCVICVRAPNEVIDSFARYEEGERAGGGSWEDLWLHYIDAALDVSGDLRRAVVCFDEWFANVPQVVRRLAAVSGLEATDAIIDAIGEFVSPALRHDHPPAPSGTPRADAVYTTLCSMTGRLSQR